MFDLASATNLHRLGLDVRTRADGLARELAAVDSAVCELFRMESRVAH